MKKSIKIVAISILVFGISLFVLQMKGNEKEIQAPIDGENVEKQVESGNNSLFAFLEFEGVKDTEDNPWHKTAGLFELEDIGECIFLTPNMSVHMLELENVEKISLQTKIHPWVQESSDGAGILVWIMDNEDNILDEKEILLSNEDKWKDITINLAEYESAVRLKLTCNNGSADNDNGDWVIIKDCSIDSVSETENTSKGVFGAEDYVKSATYFSDEWPINFWNTEMDDMESEFCQIKEDGFDSIIIVIPWREFQPTVDPVTYNEYAFDSLDVLMKAADECGLEVYTRLGYTWDYYNDDVENIVDRFAQLPGNSVYRSAWYEYVEKMYGVLSGYENFRGGFLTWEDYWNTLGVCDEVSESNRLKQAQNLKYQEWVQKKYELEDYNQKYGTAYKEYKDIAVPTRKEPAMYAMYEFFDYFLNDLLRESQVYFPDLSMEVRLDWDVTYDLEGNLQYFEHKDTYLCENSSVISTMYGIPMGCINNGEKLSYKEALEKTEYILRQLDEKSEGKAIYIEQFLFADNTPAFSKNAQIKEKQVNKYLETVADTLLDYSEGYGIWTYRNYRTNMVYNPQFALAEKGWETEGDIEFDLSGESNVCIMKKGASLFQNIPDIRNHFPKEEYRVSIDVKTMDSPLKLKISVGNELQTITVDQSKEIELVFPAGDRYDLKIEVLEGKAVIDNINLYSHVQEGFLYDERNEALKYIDSLRILNNELKK